MHSLLSSNSCWRGPACELCSQGPKQHTGGPGGLLRKAEFEQILEDEQDLEGHI